MLRQTLAVTSLAALLAGCSTADQLAQVGQQPTLNAIQDPTTTPGYRPVQMPMPEPQQVHYNPNSLWQSGSRAFFKDQRAAQIGDILTVNIAIDDEAQIDNETERTRTADEDANASTILGYEGALSRILPEAVDPTNLVSLGSDSTSRGRGTSNRSEQIKLTVAAIVTQNLPNGNLVINGRQEVRVNYELRVLTISGVVRPEDITADNTVKHTQIAEARISYGGRGQLSDLQQPRYGQQIYDIVFPF